MPFKDFLSKIDPNAEGFDWEKFKTDATKEYDTDEGTWVAKVDATTTTANTLKSELDAQKLRNYDLLHKVPGTADADAANQQQQEKDPTDVKIEDLFGEPEKAGA